LSDCQNLIPMQRDVVGDRVVGFGWTWLDSVGLAGQSIRCRQLALARQASRQVRMTA
jgi:hypothetical protein